MSSNSETGATPIRILHLSDFHLREKTRWNADPVLEGLAATIGDIVAEGREPDVVAITGDLAFSGQPSEYDQARQWIEEGLLRALQPSFLREHLLMVPGNHDVNRGQVDTVAKALQSHLLGTVDQQEIAGVLGDSGQRQVVLKRLDAYCEFSHSLCHVAASDVPWWFTNLELAKQSVHFSGLCSSWMSCNDEDYGRLLLGHYQVNNALQGASSADWSVALMHHPWQYLEPRDAERNETQIHHCCHVVLRGHLHRQQARVLQYSNENCLELTAGSVYAGSDYPNAFQLLELLPDRQVLVHFWKWNGVKWIRDRNACPGSPSGTAMFSLQPRGTSEPPQIPSQIMDTSRYLRRLAENTSAIDIRGLMVGSGKAPTFPIDQLYIPLTTTLPPMRDEQRDKTKDKQEKLLARGTTRAELQEALANRRLVIVGDPGSGKTTFLHRIAYLLCQTHLGVRPRAAQDDLGLDDRPLPIFLGLAELSGHITACRERGEGPTGLVNSPAWLPHFLATVSDEQGVGLPEEFFRAKLTDGTAMVLLDSLDEAPNERDREFLSALVKEASATFSACRFVLTSRPAAYQDRAVVPGFTQVTIADLDDEAIETFLNRWCHALKHDNPTQAQRNLRELLTALRTRPEIRRMARAPVMLTALAVVHWNQKRLPEQRADLYESIIRWLASARERQPECTSPDRCITLHQELALAMQDAPGGRRTQLTHYEAAHALAPQWRELPEEDRQRQAEEFLREEELKSGIVVRREDHLKFWHLTFQEYLAARALAARSEEQQSKLLLAHPKLYQSEWRETVLLLAGVLYHQGVPRTDAMFDAVLEQLDDQAPLAEKARCFGLLGAAVQDLAPVQYQPASHRYEQIAKAVSKIFDPGRAQSLDIRTAIEAAEALGQVGDPRFAGWKLQHNWLEIPAGKFWMGAQDNNPRDRNFDEEAYNDESPVHEVQLSTYHIGKYPVTVGEFRRFVEDGGYRQRQFWKAGEFGRWEVPESWKEQLSHLNRPVTGVSWYEASAYAAWCGVRLPTEAEWERAARGTAGRKYPWGDDAIDPSLANYVGSNIDCPTPVGVYPRGGTPEGILDLAGNVLEWCQDRWSEDYSEAGNDNPTGPDHGDGRVVRGGCFLYVTWLCRGAFRGWYHPSVRYLVVGFRVVGLFAARTK